MSTAAGVGTVSSANYTVDTHVPTATVTLSDSALIAGDTTTVTFTFGEPVTNFTLADVTAPNGTFGALSAPITNGDGTQSYTATDPKTTRLKSSHYPITYDVFCLKNNSSTA